MGDHADELDERGYFWWAEDIAPKGHFAPESAVAGRLQIDGKGNAHLHLDACLPRKNGRRPIEAVFKRRPLSGAVAGILAGSGSHVWLSDLHENGTNFSFHGPSSEKIHALKALVGSKPAPLNNDDANVIEVQISLNAFDEWLNTNEISSHKIDEKFIASYEPPAPVIYEVATGSLTIAFELRQPARFGASDIRIAQNVKLTYLPATPMTLSEVSKWRHRLEDFFVLMTDVVRPMGWAQVKFDAEDNFASYYNAQTRRPDAIINWSDCWFLFPHIREQLGRMIDEWMAGYDRYGPGFHLYMATKRGGNLYTEHHFTSLIWGLEALHRKSQMAASTPHHLSMKIERIVEQVKSSKDRRWLRNRLRFAAEPDLATRIEETLASLPFGLTQERLRSFSQRCARHRNDISHFGENQSTGLYTDFIQELIFLIQALDILYHARLLQIIGTSNDLLSQWYNDGPNAYWIHRKLSLAGLLDSDPANEDG